LKIKVLSAFTLHAVPEPARERKGR